MYTVSCGAYDWQSALYELETCYTTLITLFISAIVTVFGGYGYWWARLNQDISTQAPAID